MVNILCSRHAICAVIAQALPYEGKSMKHRQPNQDDVHWNFALDEELFQLVSRPCQQPKKGSLNYAKALCQHTKIQHALQKYIPFLSQNTNPAKRTSQPLLTLFFLLQAVSLKKITFIFKFYQYSETASGLSKVGAWLTHISNLNLVCLIMQKKDNLITQRKNP